MDTPQQDSRKPEEIKPPSAAGGAVMLGADIDIRPHVPLPAFAFSHTQAFEAHDRRQNETHVALLGGRASIPRLTAIGSYKNLKNPHLQRLIDAGIVHWTPEGRERLAFVFAHPQGRPLMPPDSPKAVRISEDRIVAAFIQPAISVLNDLANANMVHGAITPENLFVQGNPGSETVVLGECLSAAPFSRIPAVFETVERGMADPAGRGPGNIKNDLYCLGVCIALALRGYNPLAAKTLSQVLHDKIEHGTYACLLGGERLPSALTEFLRGVLHDHEKSRWGIDDVIRWIEGQRLSGKQSHIPLMAARPFAFRDQKYWDMRSLAMDFSIYVQDAAAVFEKDQFEHWLKRNFDDGLTISRLDKVWVKEEGSSRDRLVANVTMALDPLAPVRYKGVSVMPQGYGSALASAMAQDADIQPYADILSQQLIANWINYRFEDLADATIMIPLFDKCRNFLTQRMPGYGIERVVYLLCTDAACMSPALRNYIVISPGHLLRALNDMAQRGEHVEGILDRHMIAFISVREAKMIDPYLGHIISQDKSYHILGILRVLAAVQRRFQTGALPALGKWMISAAAPIIDKYHDRDLRKKISQVLAKHGDPGNLASILEIVDSSANVHDDNHRFLMARQEFAALAGERATLVQNLARRSVFGFSTGRQVAMLFSTVFSLVWILVLVLTHFIWR